MSESDTGRIYCLTPDYLNMQTMFTDDLVQMDLFRPGRFHQIHTGRDLFEILITVGPFVTQLKQSDK